MRKDPRTDKAARMIAQARAWLLREHIWLGAMSLQLEPDETTNPKITYMATDGIHLFYNAAAVLKDNIENIAGVISHETAHCALGHFARRGERDPEIANCAMDHAANHLLTDAGIQLPEGGLCDPQYHGWTFERVYVDLMNKPPSPKDKQAGQKGMVLDAPDGTPGAGQPDPNAQPQPGPPGPGQPQAGKPQPNPQQLAQEWTEIAAQAQTIAAAQGKMPADLKRALEQARIVPQDWKAMLTQYATDPCKQDYRFSPPNRRHLWRGAYLPAARGEELGTMVLTIDTSGSVFDRASEFVEHGKTMLDSGIIRELVIIGCDTQAQLIGRYQRGEEIILPEIQGGGGTSFIPPFQLIDELGITPNCHAYLTDLYGDFPTQAPDYPMIWITVCPGTAPFGTTIEMNE